MFNFNKPAQSDSTLENPFQFVGPDKLALSADLSRHPVTDKMILSHKKSKSKVTTTSDLECRQYMSLHRTRDSKTSGADEQLRTTLLFSHTAKFTVETRKSTVTFPQYALLGCRISSPDEDVKIDREVDLSEPVLLNTNTPLVSFHLWFSG